jgi:tRNA-specific 2-thiouridylase
VRQGGGWAVARARDRDKDQSYVLYGLGRRELERVRFPLGDLHKREVRALAREAGLPVAEKRESQEICFVPSGDYRELVRTHRADAFSGGEIVSEDGERLGRHEGVASFTVGQRKGLGLATKEPMFVLRIDAKSRRVVVGPRSSLGVVETRLDRLVWTAIEPPLEPRRVEAMLRYRAKPVAAGVQALPDGTARLRFETAAWPVTPGQAAVFYEGESVLGGGRIRPCS